MATKPMSDELMLETIRIWKASGSIANAARRTKISVNTFQSRLAKAKTKFPELITEEDTLAYLNRIKWAYPDMHTPEGDIQTVLIGGDAHVWPGEPSIMWQAFVKVAKKIKPDAIVLNGDIIDGARISRHGRSPGGRAPRLVDELDAVRAHLKMLPFAKHKIWTMGNHDVRVDNYFANQAPELEEYAGSVTQRFTDWTFCWATFINNVEIRHRFRGGIHAAWNNALHTGITIVTNHTHQLSLAAVRNRNGTSYGIETGMLGDPSSAAFEYAEGAVSRACAGFVLLSFDEEGHIMPPEFCEMVRGRPAFRGQYVF